MRHTLPPTPCPIADRATPIPVTCAARSLIVCLSHITVTCVVDPTMAAGVHVSRHLRSSPAKPRAPKVCPVLVVLARRGSPPTPALMALLPYVVYVCFKCFRRFRCMLQLFHLLMLQSRSGDAAHVAYLASVFPKCFICFQTYVSIIFYLDIAYVSHICCNSMSQMFQLFQSYVAASGFILQVASVLFGCFMCFTHMLQVHIPNVSSVFRHMLHSNVFFMLQVFYVVGPRVNPGRRT
jgi:hypothetical protein